MLNPLPSLLWSFALRHLLPIAVAVACCAPGVRAQQAEPLYHVIHDTYGCANPRAALALANLADPRRQDPGWVNFVVNDGHCAPITPRSLWRVVFRQGELSYMTYAGTTGLPGSFYIRTDNLAQPDAPPAPPPPSVQPASPWTAIPSAAASGDAQQAPVATSPASPSLPRQSLPTGGMTGGKAASGTGYIDAPEAAARSTSAPVPSAPARPDLNPARRAPNANGYIDAPEARTKTPAAGTQAPVPLAAEAPRQSSAPSVQSGSGGNGGAVVPILLAVLGLFALAGRLRRTARSRAKVEPKVAASPSRPAARSAAAPPVAVAAVPRPIPAAARWLPKGAASTVAGRLLPGGMLYIGASHPSAPGGSPCFVDPSLEVARRDPESAGAGMPYWPSYAGIGPRQRLAYLEWLAGGRSDPRAYIGYVFLFFYGLERRLFVDGADAAETSDIVDEVLRLRRIYASNNSFAGYSQGLLDAVAARAAFGQGRLAAFVPDLEAPAHIMPLALKLALAAKVVAGQPLPFELAAAGMLGLPFDVLPIDRRVLEHARPQFLSLLRARFEAACPAGFSLQNRKDSRLSLVHRCATAGLHVDLAAGKPPLPDPATLTWTRMVNMALPLAAQLEPYARRAAARPGWTASLEAMSLLPQEARAAATSGQARQASLWLSTLPRPLADVPFSDIARHVLGEPGASRTPRRHEKACQALAALAHGLEPQAGEAAHEDHPLVLFADLDAQAPRSPAYRAAAAGAEIASAVARLDPTARAQVEGAWVAAISQRLPVTPSERLRLAARLRWSGGIPMSAARIRRGLAEASGQEREAVAWAAASAAASAGLVAGEQVAVLEKIYDGLGLPLQALYSTINAAGAARIGGRSGAPEAMVGTGTNAHRPADAQAHAIAAASTRKELFSKPGRPSVPARAPPEPVAQAGGYEAAMPEPTASAPLPSDDEPIFVAKGTSEVVHSIPARPNPFVGPGVGTGARPASFGSFSRPPGPPPVGRRRAESLAGS